VVNIITVGVHAVVRKGINNILSLNKDFNLAGEASNSEELKALLNSKPCEIVILDNEIDGSNWLNTIQEIKNQFPEVKILILSIYIEEEIINRAFKTGASGYLSKESIHDELINATQVISRGHKYLSSSLIAKINFDSIEEKNIYHQDTQSGNI